MKRLCSRFALLMLAASLGGCADDLTEVIVSVNVSAGIPCDIDQVRVTAESGGVRRDVASVLMEGQALPLSVTIQAANTNPIDVTVEGLRSGSVALRATSTVTPRDQERVLLPIDLANECTSASPCTVDGTSLASFETLPAPSTPATCEVCVPASPPDETCNRADDDCDGSVDEGVVGCNLENVQQYEAVDVTGREDFISACSAPGTRLNVLENGAANPANDESEVALPDEILAFFQDGTYDFDFFGNNVSNVWIGDNGYLAFGTTAPASLGRSVPLDDPLAPRPAIAAFWDQLKTRTAGVCVTLQDTPVGARRLLFTWEDACFEPCTAGSENDSLNFTIALEEGSDRILLLYDEMRSDNMVRANGSGAVAGITRPDERCNLSECGEDGLCASGPNAGQPCGDIQLFANEAQDAFRFIEFRPIVSE